MSNAKSPLNVSTTPAAGADVSVLDEFGEFDDILGEIASPAPAKPADPFDDILGELAEPAPAPADDLDDILGEIAPPAPAKPADPFDDILGELAEPEPAPADDLDDILGEMTAFPPTKPADDIEDILGEVSPPVAVEPAAPKPRKRAKAAAEPEQPANAAAAPEAVALPAPETREPVGAAPEAPVLQAAQPGKRKGLLGAFPPTLGGTRQVSRKAYAGMQAAIVVLSLTAAAEAAVILTRPAAAPGTAGHGPAPVAKVTVVPVDYAKVDLARYVGKVRTLSEGGRDMLRHAKVRTAIVGLDGGEQLYKDLRAIAARSPAADRMTIRDDRVTIASCDGPACGDRSFRLVYDIRHEQAAVCTAERYPDGSLNAYGYSVNGNSVLPHC